LYVLGLRRREAGQTSGAIVASREAVTIYRALATQNPEMHQPGLAASLNKLGLLLSEGSHHQEALSAINEAVDLRRTLAERNSSGVLPLVKSLRNLGDRLDKLGRGDAALAARREADQLHLHHTRERHPAMELKSTGMHALAGPASHS
jgi:tetratricopeptide (TPR) repeat protein